jgi:hypothetical protein
LLCLIGLSCVSGNKAHNQDVLAFSQERESLH